MSTLIVLFTAAAAFQLVSWIMLALGLRSAMRPFDHGPSPVEPISVVVAVRNGAASLPTLFDCLQRQTLAVAEVVVVDDHSADETAEVVRARAESDGRFRLLRNPGLGKKEALSAGISASENELIALTDDDCRPEPGWLAGISRRLSRHDDGIVVGYGPYDQRPGWLNRLVRYETLHTALLTSASVGLGKPYMAVGRNIGYHKSTFDKVGGHSRSAGLLSGDDDLFLQAAHRTGVAVDYMTEPESFVFSPPAESMGAWIRQKRRHLSTGRHYPISFTSVLGLYHATALASWIAPFVIGPAGLAVLFARLLPGQLVVWICAKRLQERGITPWFAPLDLAFHLYLLILAPIAWLRPPKKW